MKRLFAIVMLCTISLPVVAGTAYWTGRVQQTIVSGMAVTSCEYRYMGENIWRSFRGKTCPGTIEV